MLVLGIFLFDRTFISLKPSPKEPGAYEELAPEGEDYWRKRLEIDIEEAMKTKPVEYRTMVMDENIALTIDKTTRIPAGNARNAVLEDIIVFLLEKKISTSNYDVALGRLDVSYRGKALKARLLSKIAAMYMDIGSPETARKTISQYIAALGEPGIILDSQADFHGISRAIDVSLLLRDSKISEEILQKGADAAFSLPNRRERGALLRCISEQQCRLKMYADALRTVMRIDSPQEQGIAFAGFLAEYARPVDYVIEFGTEGGGQPDAVASPASVRDILERYLEYANTLGSDRRRRLCYEELINSEKLLRHKGLYELVFDTVRTSPAIGESFRIRMLDVLENPRSNTIRAALDMPLLDEQELKILREQEFGSTGPNDPELISRRAEQQIVRMKNNMVKELIIWGMREEAREVLKGAFEQAKKLTHFENRDTLLRTMATLQITSGDLDAAAETLSYTFNVVLEDPEIELKSPIFFDLAALQVQARALADAETTAAEIPPGTMRTETVQKIFNEESRIGRVSERLRELGRDTIRMDRENDYLETQEEAALKMDDSRERDAAFRALAIRLISENRLEEAAPVASRIENAAVKNDIFLRIVRSWAAIGYPYSGSNSFHREIRAEISSRALELAGKITTPEDRAQGLLTILLELKPDSNETVRKLAEEIISEAAKIEHPGLKSFILVRLAEGVESVPLDQIGIALENARKIETAEERSKRFIAISEVLARRGENERLGELFEDMEKLAPELSDTRERFAVFMAVGKGYFANGNRDHARLWFQKAENEAKSIERINESGPGRELQRKRRDASLDELARVQARLGLAGDAMKTLDSVGEQMIRNRTYRMIAYLQIYQGYLKDAEQTVSVISVQSSRSALILDILAAYRENADETQKEDAEQVYRFNPDELDFD